MFVVAFIVFQTLGTLLTVGPRAADVGWMAALLEAADTASFVAAHPRLLLGANALGQALGFGLVAWAAARLSTRRVAPFLRLRRPDARALGLAVLGWAALYPVVLWLGELNARIPLPRSLQGLDEMRGEMLEGLLLGGGVSTAFLFLTIALVPAVFEELLFRGYLQRQVERRFGARAAVVGVGVAFGLYHLSVAQAVPLSVLGVYLCFAVWATGSVWTGVLVHLLNNGVAVAAAGAARNTPGFDPDAIGEVGGPWYVALALALVGSVAVIAVGRLMLARRHAATGGRPDAAPSLPSDSPTAAPVAVPS